MKKNTVTQTLTLFALSTLLVACSSMGGSSSTNGSTAQGAEPDANAVFSDIKELNFTPPQQDYRIGAGDLLDIKVFQPPELSQPTRVDQQGNISLPLLGTIRAAGMTQIELEKRLATALGAKYLQDPQVTVFIQEFTAQRVTIEGEVKTSGVFPIKGEMTVLQAVALAGGLTSLADPAKTVLFRKKGNTLKAYNINLDSIRDGKIRDPYIKNDDRVIVHRSGTRFWLREVGSLINPLRWVTQ